MTNENKLPKNDTSFEGFLKLHQSSNSDQLISVNKKEFFMLDNDELMSVLNRYQNILEENFDQSRNWCITRIFRGNLTCRDSNIYRDSNMFYFIDSSEGHYFIFNLFPINNYFVLPAKNCTQEDEVFKFIYLYHDRYAPISNFRVIHPAKFRLSSYSVSDNRLQLTLIDKGTIEPFLPSQEAFNSESIVKSNVDLDKNLTISDAYPNQDTQYHSIHESNDITQKLQKNNEDTQSDNSDNEIFQLKKEIKCLKEILGQIVNLAQPVSLGFSVQEGDISTENFDNEVDNDRQDSVEESPRSETNSSSEADLNDSQFLNLDPQTIEILHWYQKYQDNPVFLEKHTQQVSETSESFNARRSGASVAITLAPTTNHSFLIVGDYYLFPRPDSKITTPKLNTFEICFECENFQSGAAFEVLKPAIVFKLSERDDRWQLQDRGKLRFLP